MRYPTLDDVYEELKEGKIYECSITSKNEIVDGLQEGDRVYIDPRRAVLDTLIHELLHRLRPKWAESTVRRHTFILTSSMSPADIRKFWLSYRRIKKSHPVLEA